ncbi:lysophospholipid acyltransferase family protein [Candidatus Sumerlaeota bacterium]|nr:lysophospholipid acyltransferase family protein [Candidatus Sumerlaeota bacterium]
MKPAKKRKPLRKLQFWFMQNIGCHALGMLLRLYRCTLRKSVNLDADAMQALRDGEPCIFVYWHENLLLSLIFSPLARRHGRVFVMLSPSNDAEILARTIQWFGLESVRGSSFKRPKAALLEMIGALGPHKHASIAIDGSRGPRRVLQPGALMIAQKAGGTIIPVSYRHSSLWRTKSWDRTKIPKPFSRVQLTMHPPIRIPSELPGAQRKTIADTLQQLLLQAEDDDRP